MNTTAVIVGKLIQLEPLIHQHRDELSTAANYDEIWTYMPYRATKELFDPWFDQCIADMALGKQISYVVRRHSDQMVLGATAYYDIQMEHKRLTLGYSWYLPAVWGAGVNPEVKLLMLSQAFEQWSINRVEIGTDSRNVRSYKAIKKLGATEEGLLRQHMILHDNEVTDTILFSILATEWPTIKARLIHRLGS